MSEAIDIDELERLLGIVKVNPGHWYNQILLRNAAVNALPGLIEEIKRLREVLQAMVDAEVEYMTINNLGDPEKQHNVKWARAVLKGSPT